MLILTYLLHGVSQQTLVPDGVDTGGRAGWVELPMHLLHLNYNNVVEVFSPDVPISALTGQPA